MTDPTTTQLARLVRDMRSAQNRYFRDRTSERLRESMDLEKLVDRKLGDILDRPLFGDNPEDLK